VFSRLPEEQLACSTAELSSLWEGWLSHAPPF